MKNLFFICSRNRLRSPTAEAVFRGYPGLATASAGLNRDADQTVTPELIDWADIIFVMEPSHRSRLTRRFKKYLLKKKVVCLGIPDKFKSMEPKLVKVLIRAVTPYLK